MKDHTETKIKKPPILFKETQKILGQIEESMGMPIISLWNSNNGSVCYNDVNAIYEILQSLGKQKEIGLFIKSGGGSGQASLRIINLLRQYSENITALIPLESASAATMIAIGADKILMGPLSHLTAVDTSLKHRLSPRDSQNRAVSVSLDEVNRVIKLCNKEPQASQTNSYEALFQYIHPLVIGAIDRSESLSKRICQEIMSYHMDDTQKIADISNQLNSNYPSHGYPITLKEAKHIGLNAHELNEDMNKLLLELNQIYSEMGQNAVTDFNEFNYHNHAILNIIESKNIQILYQTDEDWHYIKEERRWSSTNDESSWYKQLIVNDQVVQSKLHIN